MISFCVWLLFSYVIGSVSFSIVLCRIFGKDDPRSMFSGNPGVTNVYRQAGWFAAASVLLFDLARAVAVAYFSGRHLALDFMPWVGLALILGNRYPCFHHFKGGKGVANYLGFTLILAPTAAVFSMLAWVVVHRMLKYPFLASFAMVLILAIGTLNRLGYRLVPGGAVFLTAAFIMFNHTSNIREWMGRRRHP